MRILNISDYAQYVIALKNNRKEFEEIFASLSINVTNFFRDSMVFDRFQLSILLKYCQVLVRAIKYAYGVQDVLQVRNRILLP